MNNNEPAILSSAKAQGSQVFLLRALRPPVLLITLGGLFAIQQDGGTGVSRTWPIFLIVLGIMLLLERGAAGNQPGAAANQYGGFTNQPGASGYPPGSSSPSPGNLNTPPGGGGVR